MISTRDDNGRSLPLLYHELYGVFQQEELDAGLETIKDYDGWFFEIGGGEGCDFGDMRVVGFSQEGEVWKYVVPEAALKENPIRIKLKVVGFTDEAAEMRNWQAV